MFLNMFSQECKKISKSILYYAFIVIMFLFYVTQYATDTSDEISLLIKQPRESDAEYGHRYAEIPDQVMSELTGSLYREYQANYTKKLCRFLHKLLLCFIYYSIAFIDYELCNICLYLH